MKVVYRSNQPKAWLIQLRHKAQPEIINYFIQVSFVRLTYSEEVLNISFFVPDFIHRPVKTLSRRSIYCMIEENPSVISTVCVWQVPNAIKFNQFTSNIVDSVDLSKDQLLSVISTLRNYSTSTLPEMFINLKEEIYGDN